MLIVGRYIFQFELIEIVMFVVFNAIKRNLNILRSSSSALSNKIRNYFSFIYLSNALNWESPIDLLTNHHQYLALIHTTCVGNKRKWNLQNAERLNLELTL